MIIRRELTGRSQQTWRKISFQLPKKVYKDRDKAERAVVLHGVLQGVVDAHRRIAHHVTMAVWAALPEKTAFLNEAEAINTCQSHLRFRREITLLLLLECSLGFRTGDSKRRDRSWDFYFFFLGEGRGRGWLVVFFIFPLKEPSSNISWFYS